MIEYIYDALRISANEEAETGVRFINDSGAIFHPSYPYLKIYRDGKELIKLSKSAEDSYNIYFTIPALEAGVYEYAYFIGEVRKCFNQPLYVVG